MVSSRNGTWSRGTPEPAEEGRERGAEGPKRSPLRRASVVFPCGNGGVGFPKELVEERQRPEGAWSRGSISVRQPPLDIEVLADVHAGRAAYYYADGMPEMVLLATSSIAMGWPPP